MKTNFPLDDNTFGATPAAISLARILSELKNPYLSAKVSAYLTEHNKTIHHINTITDVKIRGSLLNMMGERVKKLHRPMWPEKVRTYTQNVAQSVVKFYKEADHDMLMGIRRQRDRRRSALQRAKEARNGS